MRKFLSNVITKSFILTILPLIYPSLFFYALPLEKTNPDRQDIIIVSIVLFILHIISLIWYGVVEHRQNKSLIELENTKEKSPKEVIALSTLLQKYSKIIKDNSDKLYEKIKKQKGHSDVVDWQWMQAKGDEICEVLYNFVKKTAEKGNDFSVSIMFRMLKNNDAGFTMLSRSSNDAAHTPRSYRNFILETEATGTYYKHIFDTNPTRPQILMNKKEVEKHFENVGEIKYSQFIALPIACQGKTVGILQIAAYNNSIISEQKSEIERFCNNYFSIAANTMLLTDKSENIMQII